MLPADCARRFELERELGSGGYGRVFLARQLALQRSVAIKVLDVGAMADADQVARFVSEARTTASIVHPHVVTIHDFGADAGVPWIAYEHIPGMSMRQRVTIGPLPWREAARAGAQVAGALAAAHAIGVVHRDVKPDNVLTVAEGFYKVIDFGIARWSGGSSVQTASGIILGTPAYIAPEQVLGGEATAASDIYAVGVLLFELLTARTPFVDDNPGLMLRKHIQEKPELVSTLTGGVPRELEQIVAQALAKQPAERPASARELCDALNAVLSGPASSDAPAPRKAPSRAGRTAPVSRPRAQAPRASGAVTARDLAVPGRSRTRYAIGAVVAGVACVAAVVVAVVWPKREPVLPPVPSASAQVALPPDAVPVWYAKALDNGRALERELDSWRSRYDAVHAQKLALEAPNLTEVGQVSNACEGLASRSAALIRSLAVRVQPASAPIATLRFLEDMAYLRACATMMSVNVRFSGLDQLPAFGRAQAEGVQGFLDLVPAALTRLDDDPQPDAHLAQLLQRLNDVSKRVGFRDEVPGEPELRQALLALKGPVATPAGRLAHAYWMFERPGQRDLTQDFEDGLAGLNRTGRSFRDVIRFSSTGRKRQKDRAAIQRDSTGTSSSGN